VVCYSLPLMKKKVSKPFSFFPSSLTILKSFFSRLSRNFPLGLFLMTILTLTTLLGLHHLDLYTLQNAALETLIRMFPDAIPCPFTVRGGAYDGDCKSTTSCLGCLLLLHIPLQYHLHWSLFNGSIFFLYLLGF